MTHDEAVDLLTRTIVETRGLGGLTAAPSDRQAEALRSLEARATAPERVCIEVDIDPGSTWGAVFGRVAADATLADADDTAGEWMDLT
jgi:hypothetical protein